MAKAGLWKAIVFPEGAMPVCSCWGSLDPSPRLGAGFHKQPGSDDDTCVKNRAPSDTDQDATLPRQPDPWRRCGSHGAESELQVILALTGSRGTRKSCCRSCVCTTGYCLGDPGPSPDSFLSLDILVTRMYTRVPEWKRRVWVTSHSRHTASWESLKPPARAALCLRIRTW